MIEAKTGGGMIGDVSASKEIPLSFTRTTIAINAL
jgi:hypothetical protein